MILVGIVLCIVGLLLLGASLRGRVISRGQYCKGCKFDLEGSPRDSANDRCPECGSPIYTESQRVGVRRNKMKLGIAASVLMLLVGVSTIGFWASGNSKIIYGMLPDPLIISLVDSGIDGALDELVLRCSRVPNPMSDEQVIHVLDAALAHQADETSTWDVRWGEMLSQIFTAGQMSDTHIQTYIYQGINMDVVIRERVHQNASSVVTEIVFSQGRIHAINSGGNTGYSTRVKITAGGIVGEPVSSFPYPSGFTFGVRIPRQYSNTTGSSMGEIQATGDGFSGEIGSMAKIYLEYDIILERPVDGDGNERAEIVIGHDRVDHEMMIIDPNDPLVPTIHDPELAQRVTQALFIMPIRIQEHLPDPLTSWPPVMAISTQANELPETIAMRVYLRLDDGKEILISRWIAKGPSTGSVGSGLQWHFDLHDEEQVERVRAIAIKLIEQGHADVILRTDASIAESSPDIVRVIDLEILFEDVKVETVPDDQTKSMWGSSWPSDDWISGIMLNETDETESD